MADEVSEELIMSDMPNAIRAERIKALMRRLSVIESLTDGELIDAVIDEAWAEMKLGSQAELLLDELIERFQGACGILETPGGVRLHGGGCRECGNELSDEDFRQFQTCAKHRG